MTFTLSAWRGVPRLLVSLVLGLLAWLSLAPVAEAQKFPSGCSPVGTGSCSSFVPQGWRYMNRFTCNSFPARKSEEAARQDIVADWTRPGQCGLTVTPNGPWLSGGPYPISFCGGFSTYPNLPQLHVNSGIPVQNFRYYNVDHQEAADGCLQHHDGGVLSMQRTVQCPYGMTDYYDGGIVINGTTYSAGYCATGGSNPAKNLGNCAGKNCPSLVVNPINVGTGNKFQTETDYVAGGAGGLSFRRYYNYGSVPESQIATLGANWLTQIGRHWRHTYDRSIVHVPSGAITTALAYRQDGQIIAFNLYGGAFRPDADIDVRLQALSGGGWKLTTANDDVETYDADGKLLSIASRAGITQTLTYSDAATPALIAPGPGMLIGVADPFGHSLAFRYDASYQLVSMTDPAGGVFAYTFDVVGNLTSVTHPDTTVRTYVYNEPVNTSNVNRPSALTGIIDENTSRFATYRYDASGRAIYSGHAGGADAATISYAGVKSTVTDALGQTRTYQLILQFGTSRVSGVSSPCPGCAASLGYDANGNVNARTDFNGNVTKYTYDLNRNLETSRTEAFGTAKARITTTGWHTTFRTPTSITEPNRTTTYTHDANGNVLTRTETDTSVTPNVSRVWTYTYNPFGRLSTEDGPRTDVADLTTYTYYSCTTGYQCGQLRTVTNAAGQVTTYDSYNAHGQPTSITDPNGLVTTLSYDSRQRLTDRCLGGSSPACAGGQLTRFEFWPTGSIRRVTNPDATFLEYTYDAAHRLTQIQDGAQNKVVYTLDNAGNRTAEATYDPSGFLKRARTRVFNTLGQLWKDVTSGGSGKATVFGYDNAGNQTTVSAPLGRNSTNVYDELNRLRQITDPNSGVTQFGFDANDNLVSVTDPRGLVTKYTYTGFGELKSQSSPDTGLTSNTYDASGNVATSTDARNAVSAYTYDSLGRIASASYKIGATADQTIRFGYDAGTHGKGRLTSAAEAKVQSLAWTYDVQGRVIGRAQTVGASPTLVTMTMGYGYDAQGRLTTQVFPSGKRVQYGYDPNGRITSVTLLGTPNVTILDRITYDPFGPITGWTWGNGIVATRTFDTDGKLTDTGSSSPVIGNRAFGYDDGFRLTSSTDSASGGPGWTLGYDLLDRLNAAAKTGTTLGYTYDANGNRLAQTGTGATAYVVSNASNRLGSTTGSLVRSYQYDDSGNATSTGATTHTYYNNGRMKTAALGSASATRYVYNAFGQRVKKSGGAVSTPVYFMHDEGTGQLVGEYNWASGALSVVQETIWLGDIPVATLRTAGVFYVHTDQLNTPRKVTSSDTTPLLRWKWDPGPFGDGGGLSETPSAGQPAFKYNLRFPGQYFDQESNLNHNYFRDYDPAIGRYVEEDPVDLMPNFLLLHSFQSGRKAGVARIGATSTSQLGVQRGYFDIYQPYAYAGADPLLWIDSYGLAPEAVCKGNWFCKACVKAFCDVRPAAIVCCKIERDECIGNTGGDTDQMEICMVKYAGCVVKNRKGGKAPPKPPEDI